MLKYVPLSLLLIFLYACSASQPEIEVVCEEIGDFEYLIKWELFPKITTGTVKIYRSTHPDNFDTTAEPLAECPVSDQALRIKTGRNLERACFLVRFFDKYDVITAARTPKMGNVQNFRDIGGYRNSSQKYIRWGMIYRSGQLNTADESGIKRLNAMGVRTLIDFRNPETFRMPPQTWHLDNIINLPISLPGETALCQKIKDNELRRGDAVIFMQDMNVGLSEKAQNAYRSMFNQLIVEDNYPVVISSNLGKDDVGLAVALIMEALEMPEEVILGDYLLSNSCINKRTVYSNCDKYPVHVQEAITTLLSADERYLSCGIDNIIRTYGSVAKYLETELGVTPEKRSKLRQILLRN
ncbi:MAG: tyrosine-protein phosphatase [Coprobacter sp.]|nr:tyrosine-protein phosphatase [Coprobacter sp.]